MSKTNKRLLQDKIEELTKRLKEQQSLLDKQTDNVGDLQNRLNEALDRKKLAGLYLQVLRLLPGYTSTNIGKITFLDDMDYARILSVLEVDDFPEGF